MIQLEALPPPDVRVANWPWPLKITTLGGFKLFKDGEPLALSRKTPRRLFSLLKALIAFGGTNVAVDRLIDTVWPDEDGDSARKSFDVAIHRLRKLLGDNESIQVKGGAVGLDPARCWLDIWAFEDGLSAKGATRGDIGKTLALYGGDFLAGDEDLFCAEPRRQALRAKFVKATEAHAGKFAESGDWEQAAAHFRAGIKACPDAEPFYQGVIRCHAALGEKAEAMDAYRQLRAALVGAGAAPSSTTETLVRNLSA